MSAQDVAMPLNVTDEICNDDRGWNNQFFLSKHCEVMASCVIPLARALHVGACDCELMADLLLSSYMGNCH